jgi:hypothetical protein
MHESVVKPVHRRRVRPEMVEAGQYRQPQPATGSHPDEGATSPDRELGMEGSTCMADIDGFSLHAAVRCSADDRQALEQLCPCITRPAIDTRSDRRLRVLAWGTEPTSSRTDTTLAVTTSSSCRFALLCPPPP